SSTPEPSGPATPADTPVAHPAPPGDRSPQPPPCEGPNCSRGHPQPLTPPARPTGIEDTRACWGALLRPFPPPSAVSPFADPSSAAVHQPTAIFHPPRPR